MTDHLNATHTVLAAATLPQCIDDIAKALHGTPTKTQLKAVETELKKLHKAGLLESTPGRGGVHYYSLTTPTQPAEPQPRPAAVAVQAAVKAQAPSDTTEQLRESHANELALSQTIVEICCAIGRDPAATTTGQLPQLLRDYIGAQIERETAGQLSDRRYFVGHLDAIRPIAEELLSGYVTSSSPGEAVRTMSQLIDAQHAHLQAQIAHIEHLEAQIVDLRARIEAQVKQHQADTGLLADKNQRLHAEIEHLRSQPAHTVPVAPEAYIVTRLFRDSRGKTVADSGSPTRHKSIDTASRKARSAIRGGYTRAEIRATTLVAVATLGAEIKVKTV